MMQGKFKIGDKVKNDLWGGSNKSFVEGKVVKHPRPYGDSSTDLWEYVVQGPGPGGKTWVEYEQHLIFTDSKKEEIWKLTNK
jgi:hypothetical protein